jgi:hypothetical protein
MKSELLEWLSEHDVNQWYELKKPPYCLTIKVDRSGRLYMFNYNQIESDFSLRIVQEARGCIVDKKEMSFACVGFDKFFNYGESNAAKLTPPLTVGAKMDGSIIKLFWNRYTKAWQAATNGTIDAYNAKLSPNTENVESFGELFWITLIDRLFYIKEPFAQLDIGKTYIFELCSKYNRVVVPWDKPTLFLIGIRDNISLEETSVYDDSIWYPEIPRPEMFPEIQSIDDAVKVAADFPFTKEGFVVMDRNFNRVKVKGADYLRVHRLRGNNIPSFKHIFEMVRSGEQSEFLSYFPEYIKDFDKVQTMWSIYLGAIKSITDTVPIIKEDLIKSAAVGQAKTLFAKYCVPSLPPTLRSYAFPAWDGKQIRFDKITFEEVRAYADLCEASGTTDLFWKG